MAASADRAVVTSVTENYVDMLLEDGPNLRRAGLIHHFDPKKVPLQAENGICFHVNVAWDRYEFNLLFDCGLTGQVLLHNTGALGLSVHALDHIVISHGHPDHYGGLPGLLSRRSAPVPVSIHPDAFLPRYLRLASGEVAPYYNAELTVQRLDRFRGRPVLHRGPVEIGPGILATGEIPREVDFEHPNGDINAPNALLHVVDEQIIVDVVPDDQALVVEIGKDGILVLVGCSHAGVINTVKHAMDLTGRTRVAGLFGGFHLGFPGVPDAKVEKTIEALHDIDVQMLCPMHCTGMKAMMQIAKRLPDSFLLNCTGSVIQLTA